MPGPERELIALIAAAPQDPAGFRAACGRVRDWNALIECAAEQGVAGVLLAEVRKLGYVLPADAARKLDWQVAIASLQWQMLRTALSNVLGVLTSAGVRAAVLKGTILGERLYETPDFRPTSDIDILVADADCERAVEALVASGWQWEEGPLQRYHRRYHHHLMLHQPNGPLLEIHFRALMGFGIAFPSEELLRRALPYRSGDDAMWVLCPEDEVVHLALHAAAHLLSHLMWLYDLKLLLLKNPRISWPEIFQRAAALRVQRPLAFARRRLHEVGAPVAAEMRRTAGRRERMAEAIRRGTLRKGEHSIWGPIGGLLFQALLSPDVPAAARMLAQGIGHITRRRVQRYLPWLVPEEWSG